MLTLQETRSIHDSMNIPKIEFTIEACFACATRVLLAVNHNTSITSGERVRCSKTIAQASELRSCQSNLCNS